MPKLDAIDEATFDYQKSLLTGLSLTKYWYNSLIYGPVEKVDDAFFDRFWNTLYPADVTRAKTIEHHLFILGILRTSTSVPDILSPYGIQYPTIFADTQTLWSEFSLTINTQQSSVDLFASLRSLLGDPATKAPDKHTLKAIPITLAVHQILERVKAKGFGPSDPPSGLIVNVEDPKWTDTSLYSCASGIARELVRDAANSTTTVISSSAGLTVSLPPESPFAGICGMLRSLNLLLLNYYWGKLNLSFLTDQYICKIYRGDFMALLHLFKHLLCAIAWAGCHHLGMQNILIIVDGISLLERPGYIEQWSNIVRILRETVFRIRETPDAAAGYLYRGLNLKYMLVHPTVCPLPKYDLEIVVNRSDALDVARMQGAAAASGGAPGTQGKGSGTGGPGRVIASFGASGGGLS